jgi:hypothetical protein
MTDTPLESAELQQAAATGAAAAVGEVADKQRVEAEAEAARAAAETSASIAEVAATASTLAAETAQQAVADAEASRTVAESAVQQAGSAHDAITALRTEFSEQLGQLTQSVRSLLTSQEKPETTQVTNVAVSGEEPKPQTEGGDNAPKESSGNGASNGDSERRRRHKFGRRLYRRTSASCPTT